MDYRIFNVRILSSVLHRVHTDALDLTASLTSRVIGEADKVSPSQWPSMYAQIEFDSG